MTKQKNKQQPTSQSAKLFAILAIPAALIATAACLFQSTGKKYKELDD